ncbi:PSPA7_2676 family Cys-rich small protein [Pseudomonas sp. Gutcm_11s]|uniref:PSPA7_2676 family Cys-rich small protein n=1 Tax=Pseudomonas sp. Gutcm_11s TaxID=3026088 RepID=UPI00235DF72E|nr:PSPA7_2676 family Cys-rich small protein [Pseudomonas sp. Gutcm_11s]MDD0843595.1 hypothetical protein [Pseudomonas sp. Gutcm_11s]
MRLLCLISGCQWFSSSSSAMPRVCGSDLLHECCSRCGGQRFLLPGEQRALFSLRPGQRLPWN